MARDQLCERTHLTDHHTSHRCLITFFLPLHALFHLLLLLLLSISRHIYLHIYPSLLINSALINTRYCLNQTAMTMTSTMTDCQFHPFILPHCLLTSSCSLRSSHIFNHAIESGVCFLVFFLHLSDNNLLHTYVDEHDLARAGDSFL